MKLRFRTKLFIAATAFGALLAAAGSIVLYYSLQRAPISLITGGLAATVAQAGGQIRADDVLNLAASPVPNRNPRYNRVHGIIERVRGNLATELPSSSPQRAEQMISNYYVLVRTTDPNIVRIVVARRREDVGRFIDITLVPGLEQAWEGLRVTRYADNDPEGRAMSAFAPIRDMSENAVGVIGMDVSGQFVEPASLAVGIVATAGFGVAVLLSTALAWLLAHRMNRPVALLDGAVQQVARGDLDTQLPGLRGGDEFDALFVHFNQMVDQLREGAQVKRSLALASDVQRYLLPQGMPKIEGFEVAGGVKYCDETGGDYYDVIDLTQHELEARPHREHPPGAGARWGLAIGDVTGHGIAAALLMAWTRAVLRTEAPEYGEDVAGLFRNINRHLMRDADRCKFLTLFYGVLDPAARQLIWISAGHEPGLLYRARTRAVEELMASEIPLGIEDRPFRPGDAVTLEPGDVLLVATDGVTQAADRSTRYFGVKRLGEVVTASASKSAETIRDDVITATQQFLDGAPQQDDITLIVLKAV